MRVLSVSSAFLSLLAACLLVQPGSAKAESLTLDVSGSLSPHDSAALCFSSGCTLGGAVVIDNTTGTFISADVTMSGESPIVGPFTQYSGVGSGFGLTWLILSGASTDDFFGEDFISLLFAAPTPGSLVSFDGGPLDTSSFVNVFGHDAEWDLISGSPTPAPTPEPASFALVGAGLLVAAGARQRRRA
jgi:hypothetical protein